MPQFNLTVNNRHRIITSCGHHTSHWTLPQASNAQIISASSLRLNLPQPPNFFIATDSNPGWALTTRLDLSEPPFGKE